MYVVSGSEAKTESLGERLGTALTPGKVVALFGDLGAGKTVFVRGIARGMGITGRVTSPTFTIVNEYFGKIPLFHFDMYRLASSDELYGIGWDDYLARDGVCVIEWSERVEDALPAAAIRVTLARISESERWITVDGAPEVFDENIGL